MGGMTTRRPHTQTDGRRQRDGGRDADEISDLRSAVDPSRWRRCRTCVHPMGRLDLRLLWHCQGVRSSSSSTAAVAAADGFSRRIWRISRSTPSARSHPRSRCWIPANLAAARFDAHDHSLFTLLLCMSISLLSSLPLCTSPPPSRSNRQIRSCPHRQARSCSRPVWSRPRSPRRTTASRSRRWARRPIRWTCPIRKRRQKGKEPKSDDPSDWASDTQARRSYTRRRAPHTPLASDTRTVPVQTPQPTPTRPSENEQILWSSLALQSRPSFSSRSPAPIRSCSHRCPPLSSLAFALPACFALHSSVSHTSCSPHSSDAHMRGWRQRQRGACVSHKAFGLQRASRHRLSFYNVHTAISIN